MTLEHNEEAKRKHSNSIRRLKRECDAAGMSNDEFRELYFETLDTVNETKREPKQSFLSKHKIKLFVLFISLLVVYNFRFLYSSLVSNLQEYIYPSLRLLRRLSIPIISLFPALTELYQETCLIHNPFFTVVDMDCWPCSNVDSIHEMHDLTLSNQQNVAPFIYETTQPPINLDNLEEFYIKNKNIFDEESQKVLYNNKYFRTPKEMFKMNEKSLYIWKLNTINAARLLRQIIPRPKIVPKFGQSTERFIIIDSSHQYFTLPDTECNYSFLLLLNGNRNINLIPAEECKTQCKQLSVHLKESYLLWYNWWYWRPVIQATRENNTLVAHVGSYC